MIKQPDDGRHASSAAKSPADQTRSALVHAALKLFASQGYHATSTRQIAALAKANIGSIAYHFGGKAGLRAACANFIVEMIGSIAGAAFAETPGTPSDPTAAQQRLNLILDRMAGFVVARPEAGEIVQFVLRELSQPSEALDIIYEGVFDPVHRRLCAIWAEASGEDAESERTRITVFTMIGQVVYFRIAREAVMRRMGWSTIGPEQAGAVVDVVRDNLDAVLAARRRGKR